MKIVHYPHPSLRHPAKPVPGIDNSLRRVVAELFRLMYENKGLGLAAPQIGLPFQLFVMNLKGDAAQPELERVYINPVISDKKGSVEGEEGCLSFPGLFQKVRRARSIRVRAYDQHGGVIDRELSDLEARVVQHETDHLHGRLFIDYFGAIQKLASRNELAVFESDFKKAQEKGELPFTKALQRQLKELEARTDFEGLGV
jgi:peptide deformylase